MKRVPIFVAALAALSLPAWVPAVALSDPARVPAPAPPRVWDAGIDGRHYTTGWYLAYIHRRAEHGRYLAHVRHWRARHAYLEHLRHVAQVHEYLLYLRYHAEQAAAAQAQAQAAAATTTTLPYVAPTTIPYTTTTTSAPQSYNAGGYVDPSSLPYPWSCIVRVESGGTNTSAGDGGGYFQFEPGTWAGSGLSWPPTQYSFATQYAYAQSISLSNWQDGCT